MSRSECGIERQYGWRKTIVALGIGSSFFGAVCATQAQQPPTWSVPARLFSAEIRQPALPGPAQARPAPATSTGGLPPQYQTSPHVRSKGNSQPQGELRLGDGILWFVVMLVERPILVEAQVSIDGKPYPSRREERINRLLEELAKPGEAPLAAAASPPAPMAVKDAASVDMPAAARTPDDSFPARLKRYVVGTKRTPSRAEIHWLMQTWKTGPTLLLLDDNFQRARADSSPLFKILDRDEDGVLSATEIASAADTLWRYDADQDDVLSLKEIHKAAERTPDAPPSEAGLPPLMPLDRLGEPAIFRRLCEKYQMPLPRFDSDGDGVVADSELAELKRRGADLLVRVAFDARDSSRSHLDLVANDPDLKSAEPALRETSLTIRCGGTLVEFAAVQSPGEADTDQISLGAVRDGYPLLPEMDANEDGRLTVREVRDVSTKLKSFDRDLNGKIERSEVLPTLRVAFGLGPIVHRHLAAVRSLHRSVPATGLVPPDWFSRMDRDQDGDLSPREFLGGKEQFMSLDENRDGLISVEEAQAREP